MLARFLSFIGILCTLLPTLSVAGPPYVSDDPEPTDYRHFEIYFFNAGTVTRDGSSGILGGIDFNYGGARDLQLTAVIPYEYDHPALEPHVRGVGNIELAAKYKFLHQDDVGVDVAFFPRAFLPSASTRVGERHASVLLPLWIEKDWGAWSTFGGGGCTIHRGGDAIDFCLVSWALARQLLPKFQLGAEIYHQTPAAHGDHASTGINFGLRYDATENVHMIGAIGPGIQNAAVTNQFSWYAALLVTF